MNFELSLTFVLKPTKHWKIIHNCKKSRFGVSKLVPGSREQYFGKKFRRKKNIAKRMKLRIPKSLLDYSFILFFEPNKTGQPPIYSESLRSLTSRPVLRFPFLLSPRKKCSLVASKPFLTFLFSCLFLFSLQAFFFLLCEKLSTYCSSLLTQSYWAEILYKVAFINSKIGWWGLNFTDIFWKI